jgi:hypothetical protein
MSKGTPYACNDIPPADLLVEAKLKLIEPGPEAPATPVLVDAGPERGQFAITFVPRQYSNGSWHWEIWRSKRVVRPSGEA